MQVRVLYIHWVDRKGNNHLVGELRELLDLDEVIYELEYYKDCVDYLSENYEYFDMVSDCPYQKSLLFRYINRLPWFILDRTPSDERLDLSETLAEAGLEYYDRWAYMTWSHGVSDFDRYFVSEIKDDKEFRHPWLHELTVRWYNESKQDKLNVTD